MNLRSMHNGASESSVLKNVRTMGGFSWRFPFIPPGSQNLCTIKETLTPRFADTDDMVPSKSIDYACCSRKNKHQSRGALD